MPDPSVPPSARPFDAPRLGRGGPAFELVGRFTRFFSVALLAVPVGYVILFLSIKVLGVSGVVANLIVTTVVTPPNFVICRRWVWKVSSPEGMRQQVISFWAAAAISTLLTTITIWWAQDEWPGSHLAILVASLGGLVLSGLLRFAFLDRIVFAVAEAVEDSASSTTETMLSPRSARPTPEPGSTPL